MIAVNRSTLAGDRLFWGRFTAPERQTLVEIRPSSMNINTARSKRRSAGRCACSRFPTPLRRLAWWMSLNLSAVRRAHRIGTFGLSTVASLGAVNRFHPTCTTTSLSYGPLFIRWPHAGDDRLRSSHDQWRPLARALAELEAILQGPIAEELATLKRRVSAA